MTDGVDTAVKDDEVAPLQAARDGGPAQADFCELPVGDHAVLAASKVENRGGNGVSVDFDPHSGPNSRLPRGHDLALRRTYG